MDIIRRNQAFLTEQEKKDYVVAALALKRVPQNQQGYDWFIQQHAAIQYYAHMGPSFLPWHRYFLFLFEQALRKLSPNVTVPYWDWTVDRSPDASPWTEVFLGGDGQVGPDGPGEVTTGPFAYRRGNWRCVGPNLPVPYLTRNFGPPSGVAGLPTAADVEFCMGLSTYDQPPWNEISSGFRPFVEGWVPAATAPNMHNRVHTWVGGNMTVLSSPNDPVFFLHHANLDRLWSDWQDGHPDGYQPKSGGPAGQNQGDVMYPWVSPGVTIASVLDRSRLGGGYLYDTQKPTARGSAMLPGDVLHKGDSIWDPTGSYQLSFQTDGNVVLYRNSDRQRMWTTWTDHTNADLFIMEMNGDLAVHAGTQTLWSSRTSGHPGSRLHLQAQGNAQVTSMDGSIIWDSAKVSATARAA
jgi:hypothetical protein